MNGSALSPAWLRQHRAANSTVFLTVAEAFAVADAIEIADSCARSDIESNCDRFEEDGERYYDPSDMDPLDDWAVKAIGQAVRYLEARGLIERHANGRLVRLVSEAVPA